MPEFRGTVVAENGVRLPVLGGQAGIGTDAQGNIVASPPIGFGDIIGHSGIADSNGVSQYDFGPAHKIMQFLQPAIPRSCAMGSAVHSLHDRGNGANGDGGWAHAAAEFDRQEQVTGYPQTTLTGSTIVGATTLPVAALNLFAPLEIITVGFGANTENLQVSGTFAGGSGAGNLPLQNPATKTHAASDPCYHALANQGYLAKSSLVIIDAGGNDVPYLGPGAPPNPLSGGWQSGVFGTNAGASRGLSPFMQSLRFTMAQMRCSVIYRDSHPNINYTAGQWAALGISSTASHPSIYSFGGGNQAQYHYTTTAGATLSFSTPPDFPGGTVAVFSFCYNSPSGAGALWSYSVAGATTKSGGGTAGSLFDHRNVNFVNFNDATAQASAAITGTCFRITGLNPGVNTVTLTAGTLATYGIFLGWGIEAPTPPVTIVPRQFRLGGFGSGYGYGLWSFQPYYRRSFAGAQTASVAAGAGTAPGSVTLGSAIVAGAAGTGTNTQVYSNDTIALDAGNNNEEVRRIVGIDSTTTLHVDAPFVNAHTSAPCVIGLQDADFVGGGYRNTNDTQGKASVPGLNGAISSVVAEFDGPTGAPDFDTYVNNGPGFGLVAPGTNPNTANDGVHFSDTGASIVAYNVVNYINSLGYSTLQAAKSAVANKRTFVDVYGEAFPAGQLTPGGGARSIFSSNWQNYFPFGDGNDPRTGYYKDSRTRGLLIRGCVTFLGQLREDQLPSPIFNLPLGFQIPYRVPLFAWSSLGPAVVEVFNGTVYCVAGYYVPSAPAAGTAYGKLEFYGWVFPEG